jgi:hypothetical protein
VPIEYLPAEHTLDSRVRLVIEYQVRKLLYEQSVPLIQEFNLMIYNSKQITSVAIHTTGQFSLTVTELTDNKYFLKSNK